MRLLAGFFTIFLAIGVATIAWSQSPALSGANAEARGETTTTQHHEDSRDSQGAAHDISVVISSAERQPQDEVGAKSKREGDWYAMPDWWVAGFTGALFLATLGLWIFTALLWSATRRAVIDGVENIKLAKDEFVATHRPKLVVRNVFSLVTDPKEATIVVNYTVANIGGGPCWMTECRVKVELISDVGYPLFMMAPGMDSPSKVPFIGIINPGEYKELSFISPDQRWDNDHRRSWRGETGVHFCGLIKYIDAPGSNVTRQTVFRRKYLIDTQRFHKIWDHEDDHEYAD